MFRHAMTNTLLKFHNSLVSSVTEPVLKAFPASCSILEVGVTVMSIQHSTRVSHSPKAASRPFCPCRCTADEPIFHTHHIRCHLDSSSQQHPQGNPTGPGLLSKSLDSSSSHTTVHRDHLPGGL